LENVSDDGRLIEERLNEPIGGYVLSGKLDIYERDKVIQDYKVTSSCPSSITRRQGGMGAAVEYPGLVVAQGRVEVKGLRIIAILRDWSKTQAQKSTDYPQLPIVVFDIPLWDIAKQEEFIKSRLDLHHSASMLPDDEIPPCSPEERWAKPTTWAVMKEGRKTAVKVCDTEEEAESMCDATINYLLLNAREKIRAV